MGSILMTSAYWPRSIWQIPQIQNGKWLLQNICFGNSIIRYSSENSNETNKISKGTSKIKKG